jgi:hypothetical protein
MFSFHRAKVKQDVYLQSSFQNDVLLVCINFVERKNIERTIMQFRHTLFLYKWKTWLLLQIIYAVLMKGRTEAALIALSIFFLLIFFTFDVFFCYYALHRKERSSKISDMFVYICIGVSAMRYTIVQILFFGSC